MITLILGISLWLIGFAMVIWSNQRKYNLQYFTFEHSFFENFKIQFINRMLWLFGVFCIFLGCIIVGIQEYTDATWLAAIWIIVIFWLTYRVPLRF